MRVAEQAGGRVAEHLVRHAFVAVRAFADGEIAPAALLALTAEDRERNNDTVADLERSARAGAHLDDLAHAFMPEHVAIHHAGHVSVVEMKVGTADRAAR